MATQLEEVANLRTQLAQLQTTLTQVEFSRAEAYSQASQLKKDISNLKGKIEEIKKDEWNKANNEEEVFVLKTQLELYKADYDQERCARQIIKEEKDRVEEDLKNVQRRYQQLQEEIEILRRKMLHGKRNYPGFSSHPPLLNSERSSRPKVSTSSTSSCPK